MAVIIPEGVRSLNNEVHTDSKENGTPKTIGDVEAVKIEEHTDPHSVIGISLVLGFIFMLLVDQISARRNQATNPAERNVTATVGLVVHAAGIDKKLEIRIVYLKPYG